MSTRHVVPTNDLMEHAPDEDCWCGPTAEPVTDNDGAFGWILRHHSLDGREQNEKQVEGRTSVTEPVDWQLPPHTAEVMALFGFPHGADGQGDLWWRTYDDGTITLMADCSDTFVWGSSDVEPIEPEDIPLLRKCLDDLRAIDEEPLFAALYAARRRNLRPMRRWMDTIPFLASRLFEELPGGGGEA